MTVRRQVVAHHPAQATGAIAGDIGRQGIDQRLAGADPGEAGEVCGRFDRGDPADLTVAGNRIEGTIEANSTLHDALEQMVTSQSGCCCVVDGQGALQGVITLRTLIAVIQQLETEAREHYESKESVA